MYNEVEILDKIKELIKNEGMELIDVKVGIKDGVKNFVCEIDYPTGGITLDECVRINKLITEFIESNHLLENFSLEVSSPGVKRVLRNYKDFLRAKGRWVKVWCKEPVLNKSYWEGKILEVEEEKVFLEVDRVGVIEIPTILINCIRQKIFIDNLD